MPETLLMDPNPLMSANWPNLPLPPDIPGAMVIMPDGTELVNIFDTCGISISTMWGGSEDPHSALAASEGAGAGNGLLNPHA